MKLKESFILKNVTVVSGKIEEPQKDMAVYVSGGSIKRIVKASEVDSLIALDNNVQIIELDGKTIMPGMIDTHIHIGGAGEGLMEDEGGDFNMQLLRAVPQAQALLRNGFTAARDVTFNGLYLKRIFAEKRIRGPKIVSCGPGLSQPSAVGPNGKSINGRLMRTQHEMAVCGKPDIAYAVAYLLSMGADQIKFFASGTQCSMVDRLIDDYFTLDEIKYIVGQARKSRGTKVVAHIITREAGMKCLEAGIDTFEHLGYFNEEILTEIKKSGKYVTPTIALVNQWNEEEKMDMTSGPFLYRDYMIGGSDAGHTPELLISQFKMAHEIGVKLSVGTDCISWNQTPYGEYQFKELKVMSDCGMTPLELINSATQIGSEVLGLENFIGTIEEGKLADLLILNENPVEDIEVILDPANIEYVLQDGKIVSDHGILLCDGHR